MSFKNSKKYFYYKVIYQPEITNEKKVKIFDAKFIKNNKDKCKIIYKNKLYELKENYEDIDTNYNHKDLIIIKLVFIHNIINMSHTFYNCNSLISFSGESEMKESKTKAESIENIDKLIMKNKIRTYRNYKDDKSDLYEIYKLLPLSMAPKPKKKENNNLLLYN